MGCDGWAPPAQQMFTVSHHLRHGVAVRTLEAVFPVLRTLNTEVVNFIPRWTTENKHHCYCQWKMEGGIIEVDFWFSTNISPATITVTVHIPRGYPPFKGQALVEALKDNLQRALKRPLGK